MQHNRHPEFVRVDGIKEKHAWQLALFEQWVAGGEWRRIHQAHYDWWMFPIDAPSSFGYAWTVYDGDVAELKRDDDFLRGYLRGAEILALSWGWDLGGCAPVPEPHPDQRWQDWPIRLHKCATSLRLFGFPRRFESFRLFAGGLMAEGTDMTYRGRDLGALFRE